MGHGSEGQRVLRGMCKGTKGQGWWVVVRCIYSVEKQVIKVEERMSKATVAYLITEPGAVSA